jgi:hypothetical protein
MFDKDKSGSIDALEFQDLSFQVQTSYSFTFYSSEKHLILNKSRKQSLKSTKMETELLISKNFLFGGTATKKLQKLQML